MSINETIDPSMSQSVQVIGFGRRFVAYLIDGIVLWIIQLILLFCTGFVIAAASETNEDISTGFSLINCLVLLIWVGYFVGFWATTGQTPGKMVMGIKVISIDGQPLSWGKAILRYIGYIISSLILSLGFIWVAFDAKRQGWHDKIAGTYVVRKETHFSGAETITFIPSDSGGGAILAILVALIPVLILVSIVVIAILLVLGPVVGNVFSNIVENLGTPTP
jgi:uncharacterized RDD family membrane protein YckC